MPRPVLHPSISVEAFESYYWYKEELLDFAKVLGISRNGGKFELADCISSYLRGEELEKSQVHVQSDFDWSSEVITTDTIITDSYKNNQNVREFFVSQVGRKFAFSIDLMKYMKFNVGKTMGGCSARVVSFAGRQEGWL